MHAALDQHLDASPAIRNGKPRLAGTRITVSDNLVLGLRFALNVFW
jgi:uncharacterized protein (DUF433 family)